MNIIHPIYDVSNYLNCDLSDAYHPEMKCSHAEVSDIVSAAKINEETVDFKGSLKQK